MCLGGRRLNFWDCRRPNCSFECLEKVKLGSFSHPDFTKIAALHSAIHHCLVKLEMECATCGVTGTFKIAERMRGGKSEIVLRCSSTGCKSTRSPQGFFFKGYHDIRKTMALVYMLL